MKKSRCVLWAGKYSTSPYFFMYSSLCNPHILLDTCAFKCFLALLLFQSKQVSWCFCSFWDVVLHHQVTDTQMFWDNVKFHLQYRTFDIRPTKIRPPGCFKKKLWTPITQWCSGTSQNRALNCTTAKAQNFSRNLYSYPQEIGIKLHHFIKASTDIYGYFYHESSYIQYTDQQTHLIKYSKIQIIKHNS